MVLGNRTLMVNQKLGLEREELASLRHKHHIHTDPLLFQFPGVGEVESPGGCANA